jgi:peptide/nickel transport system permease protein
VPELQASSEFGLAPEMGPYQIAWRRLRRNRVALGFGLLFVLIVVLCLLAPVYAHDIAHTTPSANHETETVRLGGRTVDVVSLTGLPIGPTWHGQFFLGADAEGRDVAVRLLYGGRNSLEIGAVATLITIVFGLLAGIVAGYFRGFTDGLISRALEVIWAYPVIVFGAAVGVIINVGGLNLGFVKLTGGTLLVPAIIIGIVYIPYVARPVRGKVLSVRELDFVDAARQQGLGHVQIMTGEILPNVTTLAIVMIPLQLAQSILLEAALSFLGAGVQPPNPSWGTMIGDGTRLIPGAIHLTLVPGTMLVLCVLGINIFGDGVRDALDPRAKLRVER